MILILGGTREAREVSMAIANVPHTVSLAGVTRHPAPMGGEVRIGGFGGVAGLRAYLRERPLRAVVDATHPFATTMSSHAVEACRAEGVPLLQVLRPEWEVASHWHPVEDFDAAARALVAGEKVFLATGRGALMPFAHRSDVDFTVRVIDEAPGAFPLPKGRFLPGRPPFTVAEECETLKRLGIETLVLRNSGGSGGIEKLEAADRLGIRIVLVARPAMPDMPSGDRVETAAAALAEIRGRGWLDG